MYKPNLAWNNLQVVDMLSNTTKQLTSQIYIYIYIYVCVCVCVCVCINRIWYEINYVIKHNQLTNHILYIYV